MKANAASRQAKLGAITISFAVFSTAFQASDARAEAGAELFKKVCGACHTVGGGKRVGPDLKGVTDRRKRAWLLAFVKNSAAMIKSGDADAVKLFEQFNKTPMPPSVYTEAQNGQILDYIAAQSGGAAAPAAGAAAAPPPAWTPDKVPTTADVAAGRDMFQGLETFANGGAPCNSCHDVRNDAVIGGGVLAKDLTEVFTRMGGAGVSAILGSPPFPVMQQAYKDKPLTNKEVFSLIAFLQEADSQKAFQAPRDYGVKLFLSGVGGWVGLMFLYGLIWWRRKTRSVNHEIYARQVRSQ